MADKRKYKRNIPNKHLKIFDNYTNEYIGLLANISNDGAMFVTEKKINSTPALKYRLELLQPIMDHNEIIFKAQQRWCRKNVAKGWWESGYLIEAVGINKELLSYLSISVDVENWKIPGIKDVKTTTASELRNTTRYEVKDQYPVYQKLSYHEIGAVADLSREGVSFITPNLVEKGAVLKCKVKLPRTIFQQDYLFFDAECQWCKKDKYSSSYRSGYKFQNLSTKDEVIILYLIQRFLKEKETTQRFFVVD